MLLKKLRGLSSAYGTHGLYGVATRLSVLSHAYGLFFVGGNVLMRAGQLKLPGILDKLARPYHVARITGPDISDVVKSAPEEDRELLGPLFGRYLKQGASGILIHHEGKVVAYNWIFRGTYDLTFSNDARLSVQMSPNNIFLGNGYVTPEYRMRGLFPLLVRESSLAFGPGRCCWSSTNVWNKMSLASHLRIGFEKVGVVSCVTLLGVCQYGLSPDGRRDWSRVRGNSLQLSAVPVDARPVPALTHIVAARARRDVRERTRCRSDSGTNKSGSNRSSDTRSC